MFNYCAALYVGFEPVSAVCGEPLVRKRATIIRDRAMVARIKFVAFSLIIAAIAPLGGWNIRRSFVKTMPMETSRGAATTKKTGASQKPDE